MESHTKSEDDAGGMPRPRRRRWGWLVLLPLFFAFYSTSFNDFPVIDQDDSVLGQGDAANFLLLLKDFSLSRQYGDEYNSVDRSIGDIAQKHKIHHVAYLLVGGLVSRGLQAVYPVIGLSERQALYSVNALFGCLNILLLFLLMRGVEQPSKPKWPFLLMYAAALGTIVNASAPESWTFSASLVMAYMLLLDRLPDRPVLLGLTLGLFMLNNFFLGILGLLVALRMVGETGLDWTTVRRISIAAILSVSTWLGGLTLLSFFDQAYRPDHFFRYTLWFRDFIGLDLPLTDPYVWQSAVSNLFVNSFVSNQPNPGAPQEALLYTLQGSPLGTVATAAYGLFALVAFVWAVHYLIGAVDRIGWQQLLARQELALILWPLIMLAVTVVVHYASGFLYQAVVVPPLVALFYRFLPVEGRWGKVLLYSTLALLIINNLDQVIQFREALAAR